MRNLEFRIVKKGLDKKPAESLRFFAESSPHAGASKQPAGGDRVRRRGHRQQGVCVAVRSERRGLSR